MERQIAFYTLGIEETKEESLIQDAYRSLLKQTNPEDDPEGFKKLREAYETAVAWARKAEQEEKKEKSEFDLWIGRVHAVYYNIEDRNRPELWKELLEDPLCEDLDTSLQARDAFLSYLMEHIYLPTEVWRMIDRTFQIVEDKENLEQKFPVDFLNYMIYYIQNEQFIEYTMFRILDEDSLEPEMDADGYIRNYLAVKRILDQGNAREPEQIQDCQRKLEELKSFGLYHPYEETEELRLLCAVIEKAEENRAEKELGRAADCSKAEALIQKLLSVGGDDPYILLYCGYARWTMKQYDEAYQLWNMVLERYPQHYMARFYQARCLFWKKEYSLSKEYLLDLLDVEPNDQQVADQLRLVNDQLILVYQEKLSGEEYDPDEMFEDRMQLSWCYFQNEEPKKAIELLKNMVPEGDQEYDYYNLYGRVLYRDEQFTEAYPRLKRWYEIICETPVDDDKEHQKRLSRKFRALHILSGCCYERKDMEQALWYAQEAAQAAAAPADRIAAMQYEAYIYFHDKQYERCMDTCDQILAENTQYYPAYVQRLEAAYELRKGQQVVDDYYNAINIYAGYYKPYLLAAQTFFYHDQFQDAQGVLERARQAGVEFTDKMKLYEAKILRNLAENTEMRDEARVILDSLSKASEASESDLDDRSEIDYEKALLCWDEDRMEEALELMASAIEQNPQWMQYRMIRGNVYLQMKEYKKALNEYGAAENAYELSPALYYNRGKCHQGLGMRELALECFMKTLECQDGYRDTLELISDHYRERYHERYEESDYEKAIEYITRQLEFRRNCYYLVERGRIQMGAGRIQEAIRDFEEALKLQEDDWAAYNNMGCCYKYLGQCEKGIQCLEKAISYMDEKDSPLPYSNMADCYEILGEYEKAIECYKKDLEMFPDRKLYYKEIGLLYLALKRYEEALKYLEKHTEDKDYWENTASVYFLMGREKQALQVLEKGLRHASKEQKSDRFSDLAYYYKEFVRDYKKAATYYKKALAAAADEHERHEIGWKLAFTYFLMGRSELAKQAARDSLESFQKCDMGTEADYLAYLQYRPARLMRFAWIYIALGETGKGIRYLEEMLTCTRCRHCRHHGCFEAYLYLGRYYEGIGEYEKALEYCERACEINDHEVAVVVSVKELRKRLKRE